MKILVVNGPNLNLLGLREPEIYGNTNYEKLCADLVAYGREKGVTIECFQSNHEGALVDEIQRAYGVYDGIVLNPAAYTHTSVALLDALKAVRIPTVEVHISDVSKREAFRSVSYVRAACVAGVIGHGLRGYFEAVDFLIAYGEKNHGDPL